MISLRLYVLGTALLLPACLMPSASAAARFTLSESQVAGLFAARGIPALPGDISLPMTLTSAVPSPELEFRGAERFGASSLRVHLFCKQPNQCVPFLAMVDLHEDRRADAAERLLQ